MTIETPNVQPHFTFRCACCEATIAVSAPNHGEAERLLPNHGWWVVKKPGQIAQYAHNLECRKQMPGYVENPMGGGNVT